MLGTLETMKSIISDEFKDLDYEQLALRYQSTLTPSILAQAFVRLYNLIYKQTKKYWGLTDADYASFALEELDNALLAFVPGRGQFLPLYMSYLRNRYRNETVALTMQKRSINSNAESYEQLVELGNIKDTSEEYNPTIFDVIMGLGLTPRQKEYCLLASRGWDNRSITKKLGVSRSTLYNDQINIRKKLLRYIT